MKKNQLVKKIEGRVASAKADKTIVVVADSLKKHYLYGKSFTVSKKFYAHDEKNQAKKNDNVIIELSKPVSKLKRWNLVKIIKEKK